MATSVLTNIDQLRRATESSLIKSQITAIATHLPDQTSYVFPRLAAGLAADSNTTKQNFTACLLFISKKFSDEFSIEKWLQVIDQKLNPGDVEDGKRIKRNVCFGRILAWSIICKLFPGTVDWSKFKSDLEGILKEEPLTKSLVYELMFRYKEHIGFQLDERQKACPVTLAMAMKTKNKAYIKALFGSKTIDLAQTAHQTLALGLLSQATSDTHQMKKPPLLRQLANAKNATLLIDSLAQGSTRNRKKTALDLYLLRESLDEPSQHILGAVRSGLYNPELKHAINEDFFPAFLSKLQNADDETQMAVFLSFVKFEPMLDQNTRSRNLLKMAASLSAENLSTYIKLLISTCKNQETELSSVLPDETYDMQRWCILALENVVIHNRAITAAGVKKVIKFLVQLGFVDDHKNQHAQHSIGAILNSKHVAQDVSILELIEGVRAKIDDFPEEIWKAGLEFSVPSMKPLMQLLLVKLVELYVNNPPTESPKETALSKHNAGASELEDLKNSILDLASIERDVKNKVERSDEGVHWTGVMMEILISVMTKESRLLRKGAVDSFRQIVGDLDAASVQILADAIEGRSLDSEGYGLTVNEEAETDSEESEGESDEEMDDGSGDESDGEKASDSGEEDAAGEAEGDAEFRSKLMAVLGDDDDSSNAGSELDDMQIELDQSLSRIFRERKKHTHKRQRQELQAQATNFRIRLLDFVEVLASSRYAGLGLNRDQAEPEQLASFLTKMSPALAYCILTSGDAHLFQRTKAIITQIVKRKFSVVKIPEKGVTEIKENLTVLKECLKKCQSQATAQQVMQLVCFNIKILRRCGALNSELLMNAFNEEICVYVTKRSSSNFSVALLNELPQRFSEVCGTMIGKVVDVLPESCHKSRTLKVLSVATTCANKAIEQPDTTRMSSSLKSLAEKSMADQEILIQLAKCANAYKLESVLDSLREAISAAETAPKPDTETTSDEKPSKSKAAEKLKFGKIKSYLKNLSVKQKPKSEKNSKSASED